MEPLASKIRQHCIALRTEKITKNIRKNLFCRKNSKKRYPCPLQKLDFFSITLFYYVKYNNITKELNYGL